MNHRLLLTGIIAVTGMITCAYAQPLPPGAVVLSVITSSNQGELRAYDTSGVFLRTIASYTGGIDELHIANNGIYAASSGTVVLYDLAGNVIGNSAFYGPLLPQPLSPARDGTLYAGRAGQRLVHLTAGLQFIQEFAVGNPDAYSIDLAPDNCLLVFRPLTGQVIRQLNVCTGTLLPDLPVPFTSVFGAAIRILPNGNFLAADYAAGVREVTPGGAIVRTYTTGTAQILAISPDGGSFWVGAGSAPVLHIDLVTGNVIGSIATGANVSGIAVAGGFRAALVGPSQVPAMQLGILLLCAMVLAAVGMIAVRSAGLSA